MKSLRPLLGILALFAVVMGTYSGIVYALTYNYSHGYDEVSTTTDNLNPISLTVVGRDCSSITIYIEKSADSVITEVRYSPAAYPTTRTDGYLGYSGTAPTVAITPLYPAGDTAGHIYYFSAWGYNSSYGWSTLYTTVSTYTEPCVPTSFEAVVVSSSRIDLSWVVGTGSDATYIYRKAGGWPSMTDGTLVYSSSSDEFSDTGLSNSTHYYYRAWSYDSHSGYYSTLWAQDDGRTFGPPVVVTQEAELVTSATATLKAYVEFTGQDGADCYVRFQYGIGSVTEHSTDWQSGIGADEYVTEVISGLVISTTYQFRAQAASIVEGYSSPVSGSTLTFTTCSSVGAPDYLYADAVDFDEVDLSWLLGTCSDWSILRYATTTYPTSENSGILAYSGPLSSYDLTGLSAGTTYFFAIWGTDSSGAYVSASSTKTVVTTPPSGTQGQGLDEEWPGSSNWFLDPDCSGLTRLPFYTGLGNAATGIGWSLCTMVVFIIFIIAILAGMVTAAVSKGNLSMVLAVMGVVILIGVLMGPVPKVWFIVYLMFAVPTGYLLPKGAGV